MTKNLNLTNVDLTEIELTLLENIPINEKSHFWYGGTVATMEYKGYLFSIEAVGDVVAALYKKGTDEDLAYVKDKSNSAGFYHEMREFIDGDKELSSLLDCSHKTMELELDNNNWWECFIYDQDGKFYDLMWNLNAYSIDEAIEEVIVSKDEMIKYIEEL